AEMEAVRKKEGERILGKISPDAYVITLEIDGKMITSEGLARKMEELATYGKSKVVFVIGGSLGISESVQGRSDCALAIFQMTFPHALLRLVMLDRVLRSFVIVGEDT